MEASCAWCSQSAARPPTPRRGDLLSGRPPRPEDPTLTDTALREAEEEIGLSRDAVSVVGALERTSTFVTNYAIHPFVGLLEGERAWPPR